MPNNLFEEWCEYQSIDVANGHKLHLLNEKDGTRSKIQKKLDDTVVSHYEAQKRLVDRIARLGWVKAAQLLNEMLPQTKKARSGDLGRSSPPKQYLLSSILFKFQSSGCAGGMVENRRCAVRI